MRLILSALFALATIIPNALGGDIDTLNYALTLENLENFFYANHPFKAVDFTNAGYDPTVFTYVGFIAAHEAAHVATLKATILSLGGTPVQPCPKYPFTYTSVTSFLQTALFLENTGVSAYDGAINTITAPNLQQAAATIATIEGRHANYLAGVLNGQTVPLANSSTNPDTPIVPADIVTAVTPFLKGCANITNPAFNPVIRPTPAADTPIDNLGNTVSTNDVNVLQYALTLEHLETAFYTKFVGLPNSTTGMFKATDFPTTKFPAGTFNYLQLIAAHESAHVTALSNAIATAGGTPVPSCIYQFNNVATPAQFLQLASVIEQAGVSAYDGAINTITSTALAQVAATIATVEGRHSQVLNGINFKAFQTPSALPVANAGFDPAVNPVDTFNTVKGFIVSCPPAAQLGTAFQLPVVPQLQAQATMTPVASSSTGTQGGSSSTGRIIKGSSPAHVPSIIVSLIAMVLAYLFGK